MPATEDGLRRGFDFRLCFGSSHGAGCHFVFCDGAVRLIGYDIDREVHRGLGHRQDGLPLGTSQF